MTTEQRASATDTGLSAALLAHIEDQQVLATRLSGIIESIDVVYHDKPTSNGVTVLLSIARDLMDRLDSNLDSVNLPKGGAA
jgi:hypothetical protein